MRCRASVRSRGSFKIARAGLLAALVLALGTPALAATTYHVAKSGGDGNPGTQASPYLTIGKAAQVMQPGDSVIIHAGEYREWVQPARGGTSENARITYKAAPGERAIIKGSERVTTWVSQGNGVWKVDLADNTFAGTTYNPFNTVLAGRYTSEYLDIGAWMHLGEVYLDGRIYSEKQTLTEVQGSAGSWYTLHAGTTTSIYANFGTGNPNTQLAEINVRESCFGNPTVASGIDYITVDGIVAMQSSEEWSPTYLGITSHGTIFGTGKYWIIQNCRVKYAKMRGICVDGPNVSTYHIIRDNFVTNCGTCGIGGQYAHNSVISGNFIQDIAGRGYYGYEIAGIKVHQSQRLTISGNIVINVTGLNYARGIWIDWPGTGNRLTGNFIKGATDNYIFLERVQNNGVNLVDNNVLVGGFVNITGANIFVHNLLVNCRLGYDMSGGSADRVYNNIFAGGGAPTPFNSPSGNNLYVNGSAKLSNDATGIVDNTAFSFASASDTVTKSVTVSFGLGSAGVNLTGPLITTSFVGSPWGSTTLVNPDGSSLSVDKDIYQNCRGTTPRPGPFQMIAAGPNAFTLYASTAFDWRAACTPYQAQFTSVVITPAHALVQPGTTQQFSARAVDQFGGPINPPPTIVWSLVGSGTLSGSGLYTAVPSEGGPFTIIASATINGTTKTGTTTVRAMNALPGLRYDYYAIDGISALPNFSSLAPTTSGITDNFGLQVASRLEYMALRFTGYISIPADGSYTFYMTIDDEASLKLDGTEVVHAQWANGERSATISLTRGMHPISLEYYQGNGGIGLSVLWQPAGGSKEVIPASALFQNNGGGTITSQRTGAVRTMSATPVVFYNMRGQQVGRAPAMAPGVVGRRGAAGAGILFAAPRSVRQGVHPITAVLR